MCPALRMLGLKYDLSSVFAPQRPLFRQQLQLMEPRLYSIVTNVWAKICSNAKNPQTVWTQSRSCRAALPCSLPSSNSRIHLFTEGGSTDAGLTPPAESIFHIVYIHFFFHHWTFLTTKRSNQTTSFPFLWTQHMEVPGGVKIECLFWHLMTLLLWNLISK